MITKLLNFLVQSNSRMSGEVYKMLLSHASPSEVLTVALSLYRDSGDEKYLTIAFTFLRDKADGSWKAMKDLFVKSEPEGEKFVDLAISWPNRSERLTLLKTALLSESGRVRKELLNKLDRLPSQDQDELMSLVSVSA